MAESFGFGPASKAVAIAHALQARSISPFLIGSGVAQDFFTRNAADVSHNAKTPADLDYLVVCLDLAYACRWSGYVPTMFVDSLGFMWDDNFYRRASSSGITHYVVQDLLGAFDRARIGLGEQVSLKRVGAVIDHSCVREYAYSNGAAVVSLGGFCVESQDFRLGPYWNLLGSILHPEQLKHVIFGSQAVSRLGAGRTAGHQDAIREMSESRRLFVSPGLTTLAELAFIRKQFVPLPPQNYSQAQIVREIARAGLANSPEIWRLLAKSFDIEPGLTEADGLQCVTERTSALLADSQTLDRLRNLYCSDDAFGTLAAGFCNDYSGAEQVVDFVAEDIGH